jgi:hypothetical protein
VALASPYLAVLVAGTVTTTRSLEDPADRVWVAPAFVAVHLGWGLGFWSEAVRPARSGRGPDLEASAGSTRGHR